MTDMILPRRALLGTAAALLAAGRAGAQTDAWPSRPIRILVGFGAGGVTDIATRVLAEGLRPLLPQPVVVENRPGASGMLAAGLAARAAPDGHVLFGMTNTLTILPSVMRNLPIDVLRDLEPIAATASSANLLVVNPAFPARSLQDFLAVARTRPPEDIAYATSGIGTTVHLMAGMIERAAGIRMRHVPYRSSIDSLQAAMSGDVPLVFSAVNSALPHLQSGAVRALAIATERRTGFLPEVPTFDEAGLPGIRSDTWFGLAGPAGLPRSLVARLASLCGQVMREPWVLSRLATLGAEPLMLGPDATRDRMRQETQAFAELAAAMGIRPE